MVWLTTKSCRRGEVQRARAVKLREIRVAAAYSDVWPVAQVGLSYHADLDGRDDRGEHEAEEGHAIPRLHEPGQRARMHDSLVVILELLLHRGVRSQKGLGRAGLVRAQFQRGARVQPGQLSRRPILRHRGRHPAGAATAAKGKSGQSSRAQVGAAPNNNEIPMCNG